MGKPSTYMQAPANKAASSSRGSDPKQTQLDHPRGVCVLPDGRVLIADTHNHRVLLVDKFDLELEKLRDEVRNAAQQSDLKTIHARKKFLEKFLENRPGWKTTTIETLLEIARTKGFEHFASELAQAITAVSKQSLTVEGRLTLKERSSRQATWYKRLQETLTETQTLNHTLLVNINRDMATANGIEP